MILFSKNVEIDNFFFFFKGPNITKPETQPREDGHPHRQPREIHAKLKA